MSIYAFDYKGWQNKCRSIDRCTEDIYADPQFTDADSPTVNGLTPKPSSPAKDNGITIEEVIDDYNSNPRNNNKPDIGAIELTKNE
jgi:hypothetical protein